MDGLKGKLETVDLLNFKCLLCKEKIKKENPKLLDYCDFRCLNEPEEFKNES